MDHVILVLMDVFKWVLSTSAMASILVVLILSVKLALKDKLKPRWHYILWMLLILRLVLPWTLESSFSIFNLFSMQNHEVTNVDHSARLAADNPLINIQQANEEIMDTSIDSSMTDAATPRNSTPLTIAFNVFLCVWFVGIILMSIYIFVLNRRLARKIKKEPNITDESILKLFKECKEKMLVNRSILLVESNQVSSPTLIGVIRPKLLLPKITINTFDNEQLGYIFLHELAHIKRKDIAMNWVMYGLTILHWFNPLLWYSYKKMREDQELACDSLALTYVNPDEARQYALTLIKLLENLSRPLQSVNTASISGDITELRRRITMIRVFNKNNYKLSILGLVILVILGCSTLTNAGASTEETVKKSSIHQPISVGELANIRIWGTGLPEGHAGREATKEEMENIVKWFNVANDIRENKSFAGTTPEAGIKIQLNTGRSISILRAGSDFEVQTEGVSYWAKQTDLRNFLDKIASENESVKNQNSIATLTKESLTETDAIAQVVSSVKIGEFPERAGKKKGIIIGGGPSPGIRVPGEFESKVSKKSDDYYIVTLTEYWNRNDFQSDPKSSGESLSHFWRYEVSSAGVNALDEGGDFPPQSVR